MRGDLLGSRLVWTVTLGFGVGCANIIGISDYDLVGPSEPSEGGSGNEGGSGQGVGAEAGQAGQVGQAGEPPLGGSGGTAGTGNEGGKPAEGGAAGAPPVDGCTPASCNDDLDCTVDTCDPDGECVHTPDTSLCDADANECIVCKVGLGCVAGTLTPQELLLDASFDELTGDWQEFFDTTDQTEIVTADNLAHTPGYSAWFLGPTDTSEQGYMDLLQNITIPENTMSLRLTGVHELWNGTIAPDEDYAVAGLFVGTTELVEFHTWRGDDTAVTPWAEFEYLAGGTRLNSVRGEDVTFDIYGYSYDTEFYFDTLSLEATLCEE